MNESEREQLKNELRTYDASGLDLDTPYHWVLASVTRPIPFFQQLEKIMGADSILYFEGLSIVPEAANFYQRHCAIKTEMVRRETLFPVPDVYHVQFSSVVIAGLCDLAARFPVAKLFDHIKAYREQSLIFTFHDAFQGDLRISENVPRRQVEALCSALEVRFKREKTQSVDIQTLRALLNAMEHPEQVEFPKMPLSLRLLSWRNDIWRWLGHVPRPLRFGR